MSNETPQAEGEPTPSVPEAPAPEAAAPPAEPPTVENKPFTYDDAVQSAGDEDDVAEPPTVAAPPAAPTAATPAAAAPVAATTERPAGIFVPKWVGIVAAAIVAALVFGGIGYAIGDSSGNSNSQNASNTFPGTVNGNGNGTRQRPQFPNGELPNGQQVPGNGTGNSNGNGTGNSGGTSGGSQTSGNTAFLGVALENADSGVGVTEVQSGSPAADAGLKTGDVITAVDGTDVSTAAAVASAIQGHSSGDQVTITYTRDGTSTTAKVTLGSRSSAQSS
jgi:membrane-associated protease RseP (regulator of RpoE activity)